MAVCWTAASACAVEALTSQILVSCPTQHPCTPSPDPKSRPYTLKSDPEVLNPKAAQGTARAKRGPEQGRSAPPASSSRKRSSLERSGPRLGSETFGLQGVWSLGLRTVWSSAASGFWRLGVLGFGVAAFHRTKSPKKVR